jgi:putative membrane protein
VLQQQGIQPEDTELTRRLQDEFQRVMTPLPNLQGKTLDLALMDAQVTLHASTALVGDSLLTPQVQNPALAQELLTERQTVQQHLLDAANLQDTVYKAP